MDNKKIRRISKKELLEILLAQAKRIEELELELNETKEKLASKEIAITESGPIAEASLKLNDLFENAQNAIDQYILNIQNKYENQDNKPHNDIESNPKETAFQDKEEH